MKFYGMVGHNPGTGQWSVRFYVTLSQDQSLGQKVKIIICK